MYTLAGSSWLSLSLLPYVYDSIPVIVTTGFDRCTHVRFCLSLKVGVNEPILQIEQNIQSKVSNVIISAYIPLSFVGNPSHDSTSDVASKASQHFT
jgi:hypothetical protein